MKLNNKLAIALVAASAGIFGFSSIASAGEGGAAAAASFTVNQGNVTGAAVGAAVGKQNAGATATNSSISNTASALGTAGTLTLNTVQYTDPILGPTTSSSFIGGIDTANLGTAQVNTLSNKVTTPLGTGIDGTIKQ